MVLTVTATNTDLLQALTEFERVGRARGVQGFTALAPGIPSADLDTALAELGLTAHPDITTIFGWHNGYRSPEPGSGHVHYGNINDNRLFDPVEVESLRTTVEEREFLNETDEGSDRSWVPVFNYNSGWIVICSDDASPDYGKASCRDIVMDFEPYEPAPNIATVIRWWTTWLDTGAVRYVTTPDGQESWYNDLQPTDLTPEQRATGMAFID